MISAELRSAFDQFDKDLDADASAGTEARAADEVALAATTAATEKRTAKDQTKRTVDASKNALIARINQESSDSILSARAKR